MGHVANADTGDGGCGGGGVRKRFFFEKKNQKTFATPPAPNSMAFHRQHACIDIVRTKSFFWFFFTKKNRLLFSPQQPVCTDDNTLNVETRVRLKHGADVPVRA